MGFGWIGAMTAAFAAWIAFDGGEAAAEGPSCAEMIGRVERTYDIPPRLLDAISMVESGRWDDASGSVVAWPWTINVGGAGRFFATKAEAVAEVRRLREAGVRNIDVGCMQVNLMHHPDAFASLDEAFEPETNVAYAGRFLKSLYDSANHWRTAAAWYHSQTPGPAAEYADRLARFWSGDGTPVAVTKAVRRSGATRWTSAPQAPRSPMAVSLPIEPTAPLLPRPPSSPMVEEMRRAWRQSHGGGGQP